MRSDSFDHHDVTVTLPASVAVTLFGFLYGCLYRPPTPPLASRKRYRYLTPVGPTPHDHTLADCYPCDRDGRLDPGFATSGNRRSVPANPVRIDDLGEPVGLLPHALADDL